MTPDYIESILRGALSGESPEAEHALYRLMLRTWPRLAKNSGELRNAVLGLEWNIMAGESEDGVELLRRARDGMRGDPIRNGLGWRNTLSALMDGWFRGISIVEIDWELRQSRTLPQAYLPRQARVVDPNLYGWNAETGHLGLRLEYDGELGEIPANKFLIAINNAGGGHPSGGALMRPLAWWWCASNFSQEWLLNFAQLFGIPFRWATYDPAQPGTRDLLASAMQAMGAAGWGVGPAGSSVELLEAAKGAGGDNPQMVVMQRADLACDLLILGQTLTTDVGSSGSRALGDVHASVRADIIDSAAAWLAEVLNEQLVPAIWMMNHGVPGEESELPWYEPSRKAMRDAKVLAETMEILQRCGVAIPEDWAYEVMDIPKPEEGEMVLKPVQAAAPAAPSMPPMLGKADALRALATMPVEAREYFLSRLDLKASGGGDQPRENDGRS